MNGDKMMAAIQSKIGTDLIEDLPIKFTAVAANIAAEKEHWFQSGAIDQAIRASVSLPLFFCATQCGWGAVDRRRHTETPLPLNRP